MQENKVFQWLLDIQKAIIEIEGFMAESGRDFQPRSQRMP